MVAIGASGILGIAPETTEGTYTAPTKFVPIRSESITWQQETVWRRPIKGVADIVGAADGNARAEGDIDMEVFTDILPYFLMAGRFDVVKAGTAPDFTYTFTPNHGAVPNQTLTVYVERAGEVFGYVGCVVGNFNFSIDSGLLVVTCSIIGQDEASQTAAVAAYDEEDIIGAGAYDIRIPAGAATPDTSSDQFSLSIENNPDPQYRLNPTSPGARFVAYGEREVTLSLERDFEDRAEFTEFRNLTAKAVSIHAEHATGRYVDFQLRSAIVDSYEVGLSGQGDLVRGAIEYMGVYDAASSESIQIEVGTSEDITIV